MHAHPRLLWVGSQFSSGGCCSCVLTSTGWSGFVSTKLLVEKSPKSVVVVVYQHGKEKKEDREYYITEFHDAATFNFQLTHFQSGGNAPHDGNRVLEAKFLQMDTEGVLFVFQVDAWRRR